MEFSRSRYAARPASLPQSCAKKTPRPTSRRDRRESFTSELLIRCLDALRTFGVVGTIWALAPGAALSAEELCLTDAEDPWSWENPLPLGETSNVVHWIPERAEFVAMGDAVLTSTDGTAWSVSHRFSPDEVNDFVWTGSVYVAVTVDESLEGGSIFRSTDLVTWTEVVSDIEAQHGVAWNGNLFVAVGRWSVSGSQIRTSPDGVTWTEVPAGTIQGLFDVVWTGSQFVAVGGSSTILTSPDGAVWTPQTAPAPSKTPYSLLWTGSELLAFGFLTDDFWRSDDGVLWTLGELGHYRLGAPNRATVAGGKVWGLWNTTETVVVSSDVNDLENWTAFQVPGRLESVASNGVDWVAVGDAGAHYVGSLDLNLAFTEDPFLEGDLKEVASAGTLLVASTHGGEIGVSNDDGETWTTGYDLDESIWSLVSNGSVDSPLFLMRANSTYKTSSDGVTWTATAGSPPSSSLTGAGGEFFSMYWGGIRRSADGSTWTSFLDDTVVDYEQVLRLGSRWIALGRGGEIRTSDDDGLTWDSRVSGTTDDFLLGAVAGGVAYALGAGVLYSSPDGTTWQAITNPGGEIWDLASNGSELLIFTSEIDLYRTTDGANWEGPVPTMSAFLDDLLWGGGAWVFFDQYGAKRLVPGHAWERQGTHAVDFLNLSGGASMDGVTVVGVGALVSVDGETWQGIDGINLGKVAAGNGRFVATLWFSGAAWSEDGLTWNEVALGSVNDVTYGDFGFVAVGSSGLIEHSVDGEIWFTRASGTTGRFSTVGWTGERYVAVTGDGLIVTSLDGAFWQVEPQPLPNADTTPTAFAQRGPVSLLVGQQRRTWLSTDHGRTWAVGNAGVGIFEPGYMDVKLVGSEFVALVQYGGIDVGTDGVNWTRIPTMSTQDQYGLTIGEDGDGNPRLLIGGREGLLQSAAIDRACAGVPPSSSVIFVDGFESGDVALWVE